MALFPVSLVKENVDRMSRALSVLQMKEENVLKFLAARIYVDSSNSDFQMNSVATEGSDSTTSSTEEDGELLLLVQP